MEPRADFDQRAQLAIDGRSTGRLLRHPSENFQGCALPRSVRTDDSHRFARLNTERHVFERPEVFNGVVVGSFAFPREGIQTLQGAGHAILEIGDLFVTDRVSLGYVVELDCGKAHGCVDYARVA